MAKESILHQYKTILKPEADQTCYLRLVSDGRTVHEEYLPYSAGRVRVALRLLTGLDEPKR